jgi:transposase
LPENNPGKQTLKEIFLHRYEYILYNGEKYKNTGNIELKRGYSKDYRMDLKQLVYLLVTTDEGLPVFAESHSGNASDNELFQNAIIKVQNLALDQMKNKIFVLDAALYSKEFLLNPNITGDWITRVPESVKMCKESLERNYDPLLWTKVDKDFKFVELESTYAGIKQRWILIIQGFYFFINYLIFIDRSREFVIDFFLFLKNQ